MDFSSTYILKADLGLSVILVLATSTLIPAIKHLITLIKEKKTNLEIKIKSPTGDKYVIAPGELKSEDIDKIIKLLQHSEINTQQEQKDDAGNVHVDLILSVVPALIALAFVGTSIFLMVQGRTVPDLLVNTLTTIIGYYFGMGASGKFSEGKKLTAKDIQKLVETQKEGRRNP